MPPRAAWILGAAALAAVVLAGCGNDETAETPAPSGPQPIAAPEGEWTFVGFEEALCGNGSSTGLGISPSSASGKVLIYLEGGGACFTEEMCLGADPTTSYFTGFGAAELADVTPGLTGIFDRDDPDNPFADFNVVYVPYCTGDVHSGDKVDDSGDQDLYFVGHRNVATFLPRIAATFPHPEQLVLAGSSAGGFGTMYNFYQVQEAFPDTPALLIDDSGPFLPLAVTPSLIVVRDVWGLPDTVPPGCPQCLDSDDADGGLHHLYPLYDESYPDLRASLLSSLRDETITERFLVDPMAFENGLNDLADTVISETPSFRVYYLNSTHHVWLTGGEDTGKIGDVVSDNVKLSTFLTQQLAGDDAWASVRPAPTTD